MALIPRLDLAALDALSLDPSTKGIPYDAGSLTVGAVSQKAWSMLDGDLPLPLAVIRQHIVSENSAWMGAFTRANGLVIAPHGKTTMSPYLFDMQVADGAWGITVANVQQMAVCARFGVKRVLIANQPTGDIEIATCLRALQMDGFELYCLVDGNAGLRSLADAVRRNPPPASNPLRVLVEIGFAGGRTGARSRAAAMDLARKIAGTPGQVLGGFECFEGLLPTPQAADGLIDDVCALAEQAVEEGLFVADQPVVVSAGGSAFFDRVGERFERLKIGRPMLRVLRSGCYLTHDAMGYGKAFERIQAETRLTLPPGGLVPAMEVWAYVQSRPESGRCILTMGKRDVGFDAGMPLATRWYRRNSDMKAPADMPADHNVVALNDQHCHMEIPDHSPLQVGDMVGFSSGHPCTTFDKWSVIMLVDEGYRVLRAIKTFF